LAFKAHIASFILKSPKGDKYWAYTSPIAYKFTKNKIHLPKNYLIIFRPENKIYDQSVYNLKELDKDSEEYSSNSKFQATFADKITVTLITNFWETWALRFTHKRTLYHRNKKWFWGIILAALLGAIFKEGCSSMLHRLSAKKEQTTGNKHQK